MFKKTVKPVNPLDTAVAGKVKKINLTKRRRKRDIGDKTCMEDVVPEWYPGRINPSHEGMIW